MDTPTTLQGFIESPGIGPARCFTPIEAESLYVSTIGAEVLAFAAGWDRDILYALIHDPSDKRIPVKVVYRRDGKSQWNESDLLSKVTWQREWFHQNTEEVARGLVRTFKKINDGRLSLAR